MSGSMSYHCEPCNLVFNGIIPYNDHIKSLKHVKKIKGCQATSANDAKLNYMSPVKGSYDSQPDPYVKRWNSEYKCIPCSVILNSLEQVQSHINGKKHNSVIGSKKRKLNCDSLVSKTLENSDFEQSLESDFIFTFHNMHFENIMSNIIVFSVDEPVCL